MPSSRDPRVLVAEPAGVDGSDGAAVVAEIKQRSGFTALLKRETVATEYLRELGPTIDCVVCVSLPGERVEALTAAAGEVPVIVYGDEIPPVPVDEVVANDGGMDVLVERITERIERRRERDALAEANAKLSALNEYTRELTGCRSVDDVSDTAVDAVTNALGHGRVVLAMLDGDVFYPYGHTLPSEPEVKIDIDEGIVGRTFETGETQIIDDYDDDPDKVRDVPAVGSAVSVPLGDHGVLQVTADRKHAFDRQDAEFLEIVASHAAEALSRLERETDLRVERDRLHAFFEGLGAPAVYVESSDGEEPVLLEANSAYRETFGDEHVGEPVSDAFPTETERTLFAEHLVDGDIVREPICRETADGRVVDLEVGMVPVPTTGLDAAAFGLYVVDVELP
ncbi:GAF domain-containing protein [Halobaculum marinum]|uniref:GAF domain-containing protein n=1 Tax=Halobaculum marinum TaxID=3031996 RepID=A0ABD5WWU9_9EURY|nr:GAF domain-containing protein [Halobaculum sp. DT55]